MDFYVPLGIALLVTGIGVFCALFPRVVVRMVCRHASSYMKEDLSVEPVYVYMFRFYGLAAVGLGLYALYQVLT